MEYVNSWATALPPISPVLDDLIISKTNEDNDDHNEKWELRLYDDADNTREKVARVLVQVTQLPEFDAFKIMTHAHNTGVATVNDQLCYEIAEIAPISYNIIFWDVLGDRRVTKLPQLSQSNIT